MKKNKLLFLSLLVMLLWGTLFPSVKLGYSAYNVVTTGDILFFAGVRFTICGSIICLYVMLTDKDALKSVLPNIAPILLTGLFAVILHYSFTYSALKLTDSSKTAILKQVGVLFYVCFSSLFIKTDKPSVFKLIGVLLGFSGIIVINWNTDGISFNIGDALIIAASFCTVFANIISKKAFKAVEPVVLTGVSQLFGGIVLLFAGKLMGGSMTISYDSSSFILVYICLASIISYILWYTVVKSGELSKLFILKFAEPAFACIFGALLLGENILNIQYLLAFLLISGGIYVSHKQKS